MDLRGLLAKNVKIGRNRLGYSQMKLAELCDVSTSFIGEIETSKKFPSVKTMEKICNALAMKPYQLFFDEEEWAVYDRQAPIMEIYQELKERINADLEDIIKRYLQSS